MRKLALLLFAAASLCARTPPDTLLPGTAPTSQAPAAASAGAKSLPDSIHVIAKESFPVIYSKGAEDKKLDGTVVLSVLFNEAGTVENSEVSSGDPMLAECVNTSIGKWRIEPFIRDSKPVKVKVPLTFEFVYGPAPVSFSVGQNPPAPPSGPVPNRVILGAGFGNLKLGDKEVQPIYPQEAKSSRIQGTVVFAVTIGKDGAIRAIYLVSGPPMLTKAAWDAVRQWHYKPYLYGGSPVAYDTRVQVNFTLASL